MGSESSKEIKASFEVVSAGLELCKDIIRDMTHAGDVLFTGTKLQEIADQFYKVTDNYSNKEKMALEQLIEFSKSSSIAIKQADHIVSRIKGLSTTLQKTLERCEDSKIPKLVFSDYQNESKKLLEDIALVIKKLANVEGQIEAIPEALKNLQNLIKREFKNFE